MGSLCWVPRVLICVCGVELTAPVLLHVVGMVVGKEVEEGKEAGPPGVEVALGELLVSG